ncbi:MAG: DUF1330 domain-containing protein [Halieaceae bacterium]|nr:DUF1330 domain-containing protein [Halieaceae bacterium]
MMKAYVIFRLKAVYDAEKLQQYRELARPCMIAYKARPIVLRGQQECLEGEEVLATVVLEFESYETALAWYNSPEYQECKKFREDAADIDTVIVEGFSPA